MTVLDAVYLLDALVDESDPDTDLPNSIHAFQTAERIRADHPDKEWFQLTGLLHDLGKVMALWGEPQYCVVGDTFPVGCKFSQQIVFPETFKNNPDTKIPEYRYVVSKFKLPVVSLSANEDGHCPSAGHTVNPASVSTQAHKWEDGLDRRDNRLHIGWGGGGGER